MKINKPIKILIGLATIWVAFFPILFWLIFFALQFYAIYVGMTGTDTDFQQTSIIFSGFFFDRISTIIPDLFFENGSSGILLDPRNQEQPGIGDVTRRVRRRIVLLHVHCHADLLPAVHLA